MVFPQQPALPDYDALGSKRVGVPVGESSTRSIDEQLAAIALLVLGFSLTVYIEVREVFGLPLRPPQLVSCVIALFCVPLLPRLRIPRRSVPMLVAPLVIASFMLLRHATTDSQGMLIALRFVVCALTYLVCLILMIHGRRPRFLMIGLVAGALLSTFLALQGWVVFDVDPIMRGTGRWQGLMPGANRMGNLGVIALLGLLATVSRGVRMRQGMLVGGIAVLLFFGTLMTGSRGALLALVCGVALYLLLPARFGFSLRMALRIRVLILTALLAVGALELYFGDRLVEVLQSRLHGFARRGGLIEAVLYDARRTTFDIALEYWRDHPWLGAGSEAEGFYGDEGLYTSAHNSYLYLLSTTGLVGFVIFMMLPWMIARRLRALLYSHAAQRDREGFFEATVALSVLACVLVHFLVISLVDAVHIWAVFAWCVAPAILERRSRTGSAAPGN